jgi:O-antigen/teichoic acid export membrane protein
MPTRAHDDASYRPVATLFLQIVVFVALTGAAFVAVEGAHLSRVLYGGKWIAADPLIPPASLLGFGVCLFTGSYVILLAKSNLRTCFILDVANACLTIPVILLVAAGRSLETYAWALGAGQTLAGAVALYPASSLLSRRWRATVLAPPLVSTGVATAAILMWERARFMPLLLHLLLSAYLYATVLAVVMRAFFPGALVGVVGRLPLGPALVRWLRLRPVETPVAEG